MALLQQLATDLNLTIALISHDLSVIRSVCSHVMVLDQGQTLEAGPCEPVFTAPQNKNTHTLIDTIPLPKINNRFHEPVVPA